AMRESKIHCWDDVYGFDYSPMKALVAQEPVVDVIGNDQVISDHAVVLDWDLQEIGVDESKSMMAEVAIKFNNDGNNVHIMDSICVHFNTSFTHGNDCIVLDTSPEGGETHWKQTLLLLPQRVVVKARDSAHIRLSMGQNTHNVRDWDMDLTVSVGDNSLHKVYTMR
ncbi:protein arginine N-methyltransferase, partial [Kipferlia bialata]